MRRLLAVVLFAACAGRAPVATPPPPPAPPPAPASADPRLLAEIARVEGLVAEQPANKPFIYILATYYDRANDAANVARWLTRLDEMQWNLGLRADSFANTLADAGVAAVAKRLDDRVERVSRATRLFSVPASVRSEGIAYDEVDDVFYVSGDAAKLLRIDRNGATTELPIEAAGRKFGRLGMDVDAGRRHIWVINAVFDPEADADERGRSAVSVYDLRDGRLLRRVTKGSAEEPAFFNDLAVLRDGTAFITDTGRHEVLRLDPGANTFTVVAKDLRAPNGIAVTQDERTLYVADFRGLNAVDLATGERRVIETSTWLNGIDGLVEYRGSLIGIQNVLGLPRVVRVHPAENHRVEVLEMKNELLNVPSTGVVAGDHYVFMANRSQPDAPRVFLSILVR